MNPTIIIESDTNEASGPPRELLFSVWPVSQVGDDLAIGEPVFVNHMVLVGVSASEELGSILRLPEPGAYLIDVAYPNGQSMRTTVSVKADQPYVLVVEAPRQLLSTPSSERATTALSWVPRVLSATPRRTTRMKKDLEVSLETQSDQVSLPGLHSFLTIVANPTRDRGNIFEEQASADLTHEILLPNPPLEQSGRVDVGTERKWLVVRCKGKAQILMAYPHHWICESNAPFKLIIGRKSKEARESYKWTTSLKLMDPAYGSMVEHLTRRDLSSTRLISESERGKAATALYKKTGNPFSAAAAAYIFALAGSTDPNHDSWMQNLSSRYSWLPDGAIALGWKTLYDGQDDLRAWEKARGLFSLACSRGLPYYTVGLHILVDALTLLSQVNPEDQEIIGLLAAAKAADVACVRTEPFTTLQIPKYLGLPMSPS